MKQPHLEVRTKKLIEVDGLQFKDLNGNGKLDAYEDWRLSVEERAKDLVSQMTLEEKAGNMMIATQQMGQSAKEEDRSHDGILNEEYRAQKSSIFATQEEFGNSKTIKDLHMRHFILRENYSEKEIALWVNAMNEVAEGTRLGIPVLIASNSRNENAERTFGMNDAVGVFSTWPGTLGLAAIAIGGRREVFTEFAEIARKEWVATGLRKGYMYMLDTVTDPRWMRIYGTFGENPEIIIEAARRLILGFQGEALNDESVALTMKHFPGGGARENGFDPHYEEGKWNIYPTEGSLEKYHLPPFQTASDFGTSSIMPYYSIPSEEKSVEQTFRGEKVPFEDVGFAFNAYFIKEILRNRMHFKGYINSDSGILDMMSWGVEDLTKQERAALAINTGVELIADTNEVHWIIKAVEEGKLDEKRLDEANVRLLTEMFTLGLFDDKTYVDPDEAVRVVQNEKNRKKAYEAHKRSVVLLKNTDSALPLDTKEKVYFAVFHKDPEKVGMYEEELNEALKELSDIQRVQTVEEADAVIALLYPKTGNYFSATPGLLELTLCENKENKAMDGTTYKETTLTGIGELKELADAIHNKHGKMIIALNTVMPWIVENIEPISDGLAAHFETVIKAQLEVLFGKAKPYGKLPITLPAGEEVIAVDENGECFSRNDVPGYDKDLYLPEGVHYAYKDMAGNEYKYGFGLSY